MRIRDIMSRPVVVCGEKATLNDAARLMWEADCGVIPIVKEDGRIAGVVTDRDICMAAYTQGKTLEALPVTGTMSRNVVSCRADDFLESTVRLMADNQVRRLPVLDADERPVGMVSFSDLVRHASTVVHGDEVDYDIIKGFAAISRPRLTGSLPSATTVVPAPPAPGIPRVRRPHRVSA